MTTSKKLFKKTLSVQMAESLEESIINGEWAVGEKMPSEPELAEIYGFSRNILREAIHYLAISGLVDVRPGDGTYVRNRSALDATMEKHLKKDDLYDILEVRLLIEPQICALAAERHTEKELSELATLHDALLKSFQNQASDYIGRDIAFHIQVSSMCHNRLLSDIYNSIISRYPQLFKDGFLSFMESDELELYLHNDLYRFIAEKNTDAARELTIRMLENEKSDFNDLKIK